MVVLAAGAELEVVQTEVEVDDVPGAIDRSEPFGHFLHARAAGPRIASDPMHIGFASQKSAHFVRVADTDGVANDHDAWQIWVVGGGSLACLARVSRFGGNERHRCQEPCGDESEERFHGAVADQAITRKGMRSMENIHHLRGCFVGVNGVRCFRLRNSGDSTAPQRGQTGSH